jgi:acetylornithine deacetylase/succinyl-diaminopimelate desuccinylase-like protein
MKGEGIAHLMTMLILKRANIPLKRDVILLATADEEIGAGVGAAWLVEHQAELFRDAEFLINEGGTTRANGRGGVDYYGVGTTEKSPFWLDMTARGTAGHGSRPTPDNPVHRLIRALQRIADWSGRSPVVVTPVVERYFRDLAQLERDSLPRRWLSDIRTALRDSTALRAITADITYNALLRNTISITGLKGSDKTNVIPPVATAVLDVRLLPGQDPAAFLAELTRVIGDTAVSLRPQGPNWSATESPVDTEMFRAIAAAARARHPDAIVTTPMLAGFTDSHYFRRMGIASYGIGPFPLTQADARGVHGNDERLSVEAIRFGVRFVYDVVTRVAGR